MDHIRIVEARIENFRLLRDVWLPLANLTVLIGANNSGKTALLQALGVALGEFRATIEDLYIDVEGSHAESFTIDLLVKPGTGDEFSEVARDLFGEAVQLPAKGPEFVAIRTSCSPDSKRGGGIWPRRSFLKGWARTPKEAASLDELKRPAVSREILELFSYNFLDARRDIVDQLQGRATYWSKLAGSLDLHDELRQQIEAALGDLSDQIIKGSPVLERIRVEIDRITEALTPGNSGVAIEPLPAKVEDLARGMDIRLRAPGSAPIPMARQGMGTRSLAALTVFSAFVKTRSVTDPAALTVLALEEPEAHLHPQAQRAVFELASTIMGQRLISTHSPYVTSVADIFDFRVFRRSGPSARISWLEKHNQSGKSTFNPEELEKVQRLVQAKHGEVLFARVVVLVEGETEEAALPIFAAKHWAIRNVHDLGISLVNVGGAQNFKQFAVLLDRLGIEWIIFSDGDSEGQKGVTAVGTALGRAINAGSEEVVMLPTEPEGLAFEAYLLSEGLLPQCRDGIEACFGEGSLDDYKHQHDGMGARGGKTRDYKSEGWERRLIHDFMLNYKSMLGAPVAEAICRGRAESPGVIPGKILDLFRRVDTIIGGTQS